MAGKIRLLIADDEVKFVDSIAERLQMRGLAVAKAYNGTDAVQLARQEKFDLALLDLKMPGLDGREVLQILKDEQKHIEVVILTGHGSLDSAVECTKLGAYGYLPKPCELDQLLEVLKEAYHARLTKRLASQQDRIARVMADASGQSALGVLRALRELDEDAGS
jgi:DNA-binding NtrC family response regulator